MSSVTNGTILDRIPIGQTVAIAGLLIVTLQVAMQPEASAGLGMPARIVFWALHVGTGLLGLWTASLLMARTSIFSFGQWCRE